MYRWNDGMVHTARPAWPISARLCSRGNAPSFASIRRVGFVCLPHCDVSEFGSWCRHLDRRGKEFETHPGDSVDRWIDSAACGIELGSVLVELGVVESGDDVLDREPLELVQVVRQRLGLLHLLRLRRLSASKSVDTRSGCPAAKSRCCRSGATVGAGGDISTRQTRLSCKRTAGVWTLPRLSCMRPAGASCKTMAECWLGRSKDAAVIAEIAVVRTARSMSLLFMPQQVMGLT